MKPIKNGTAYTSTGGRCLVLSPDLEPRPVVRAVYSGYRPDRGTWQVKRPGDVVIGITWSRRGVRREGPPEIWDRARRQTWWPLAEEFLRPVSRGPSFLPPGLGWDGEETLSSRRKRERLEALLAPWRAVNRELIDRLIDRALRSPRDGLPTNWEQAAPLPAEADCPREDTSGAAVSIHRRTAWLVTGPDGRSDIIRDTSPIPAWVTRAVRVTWGGYTRDHISHGVAWELLAV